MTAQSGDRLIYNNEEYSIATEPLYKFLKTYKEKYNFISFSSANWRGYHATWKIKLDALYLIDFSGNVGTSMVDFKHVDFDFISPNKKELYAFWFTGEIRVPQGELLQYVHHGYGSVFEKDMILVFRNGRLLTKRIVENNLEEEVNSQELKKEVRKLIRNSKWRSTKLMLNALFNNVKKLIWKRKEPSSIPIENIKLKIMEIENKNLAEVKPYFKIAKNWYGEKKVIKVKFKVGIYQDKIYYYDHDYVYKNTIYHLKNLPCWENDGYYFNRRNIPGFAKDYVNEFIKR